MGVASILKIFLIMVHTQFNKSIKIVHLDNETKLTWLKPYFFGTRDHSSNYQCWYPQQNGRVERKHYHILNVARALCMQANLPIKFWGNVC